MILKKSADDKKAWKITIQEAKSSQCTRELRTYRIHMCEVTLKACMYSYLVG